MTETTPITSGSAWIAAAALICRLCISAKETSGPASVTAVIEAVSCSGKKPFGATTYMNRVSAMVANVTTMVARWCCSTNSSVR